MIVMAQIFPNDAGRIPRTGTVISATHPDPVAPGGALPARVQCDLSSRSNATMAFSLCLTIAARSGRNETAGGHIRVIRSASLLRYAKGLLLRANWLCSGDLLPPSPPGEKATARQDQARESGANNRAGHDLRRPRPRSRRSLSYADHLPLYRQAQIYARQGIVLDRSTLADWVDRAAFLLRPVHERLLMALKAIPAAGAAWQQQTLG